MSHQVRVDAAYLLARAFKAPRTNGQIIGAPALLLRRHLGGDAPFGFFSRESGLGHEPLDLLLGTAPSDYHLVEATADASLEDQGGVDQDHCAGLDRVILRGQV